MRADLVLDLIRTRNAAAAAAVVLLLVASRVFIDRRTAWLVLLLGVLAMALGYCVSRPGS